VVGEGCLGWGRGGECGRGGRAAGAARPGGSGEGGTFDRG